MGAAHEYCVGEGDIGPLRGWLLLDDSQCSLNPFGERAGGFRCHEDGTPL